MKKSVLHHTLLTIILLVGYTASAQTDYVVTIKRDTIKGKVKYFNSGTSSVASGQFIQLVTPEGKKSSHKVMETLSFKMKDETYHTVRFQDGYTFMKLIQAGYLSLYTYQLANKTVWEGQYLTKKDGGFLDVPNIGFKKRLSGFLSDCPIVTAKIESGELNRTNLPALIDAYNACIDLKSRPRAVVITNPITTPETIAVSKTSLDSLEREVNELPDFDKKSDALEMIYEIQAKIKRNENIPSFLINGLKEALQAQRSVQDTLEKALKEISK